MQKFLKEPGFKRLQGRIPIRRKKLSCFTSVQHSLTAGSEKMEH